MSAYVIAGLLVGATLLGFAAWWASLWSASRKRDDVAPGADVPESLYAMQARRKEENERAAEFDVLPPALALTHTRAVALGRRAPTRPRDMRPDGDLGSSA